MVDWLSGGMGSVGSTDFPASFSSSDLLLLLAILSLPIACYLVSLCQPFEILAIYR